MERRPGCRRSRGRGGRAGGRERSERGERVSAAGIACAVHRPVPSSWHSSIQRVSTGGGIGEYGMRA
eukprot:2401270-Rhodomonas_salina.1